MTRNSGLALYGIVQNIFGLSFAPVAAGMIMEDYQDKKEGMLAGYGMLLTSPIAIIFFFVVARVIVAVHKRDVRRET